MAEKYKGGPEKDKKKENLGSQVLKIGAGVLALALGLRVGIDLLRHR